MRGLFYKEQLQMHLQGTAAILQALTRTGEVVATKNVRGRVLAVHEWEGELFYLVYWNNHHRLIRWSTGTRQVIHSP